ncbi:DNA (cytosine-5)-methyltransferase DRM1-like, partial [Trifolium medium]|nr:DNA (cytosine-5)-methyltransferase DRM1-like [Trifolium medium]
MFNIFLQNHQETAASSSGSKLRSFFIGMGFLPGLVDKVIEENGEGNSDALLEILLRCS